MRMSKFKTPAVAPLPLAGEHRPPSAAVLDKNAEAKLRLWRSQERGGWGKIYPLDQRVLRGTPTPALPRKRERERTSVAEVLMMDSPH